MKACPYVFAVFWWKENLWLVAGVLFEAEIGSERVQTVEADMIFSFHSSNLVREKT